METEDLGSQEKAPVKNTSPQHPTATTPDRSTASPSKTPTAKNQLISEEKAETSPEKEPMLQHATDAGGSSSLVGEEKKEIGARAEDAPLPKPHRSAVWRFEYALLIALATMSSVLCFMIIHNVSKKFTSRLKGYGFILPPWKILEPYSSGIDDADHQWHNFYHNFGLLFVGIGIYLLGGKLVRLFAATRGYNSPDTLLLPYYLSFSVVVLFYIHGLPFLFMMSLLLMNFAIAQLHHVLPYKLYMLLVWTSQVGVLFLNEYFRGYNFALLSSSLAWLDPVDAASKPMMPWHSFFNLSTLRMIAFNYDLWESAEYGQKERSAAVAKKHDGRCLECAMRGEACYKMRSDTPLALSDYTLVNYLGYLLYFPTYIGGPMSSYNAFLSYAKNPQRWFTWKHCAKYGFAVIRLFAVMLILLHFNYLNAIRRDASIFNTALNTGEKAAMLMLSLGFLWLKFSILWKFFRLMAMIDGMEVPEDMNRCFSNTVTISDFWRDWHSSFNIWIVRYMYIPLGGSKYRAVTIFPIFLFIAIWHDIQLHLLMWAGLMCVSFVVEVSAMAYFSHKRWNWLKEKSYWRHLKAGACTFNVMSLVASNLIGFGAGANNTEKGFREAVTAETLIPLGWSVFHVYVAACLGIMLRDYEEEERSLLKDHFGLGGTTLSSKDVALKEN